jgi:hypothetical protein
MTNASLLRAGMAIRHEGQNYEVIAAEYPPGQSMKERICLPA